MYVVDDFNTNFIKHTKYYIINQIERCFMKNKASMKRQKKERENIYIYICVCVRGEGKGEGEIKNSYKKRAVSFPKFCLAALFIISI